LLRTGPAHGPSGASEKIPDIAPEVEVEDALEISEQTEV
jgi:hypothetical protein